MTERVVPHQPEAERALLGTLLAWPERWPDVAGQVEAGEFFRVAHQHLFRTMQAMATEGVPIDPISVTHRLTRERLLDAVGEGYLNTLPTGVPRSTNLAHYAHLVRAAATLRGVMATATEMLNEAYESDAEAEAVLGKAEAALRAIAQRATRGGVMTPADFADEGWRSLEALIDREGATLGIGTGFRDLDRALLGWQRGELTYLAARPGMGKTAFALCTAWAVASRGEPALFFSSEMSRQAVHFRMMTQIAQVDGHRLRSGRISQTEMQRVHAANIELRESAFFIDDTSMPSVDELHNKARRIQAQHGLSLVVVDYVQILKLPRGENQNIRVSAASYALRHAARDLHVPFLVLCQLSRDVERRGGERKPMLSDLRDSGSLEQDADVVIFLHRPEVYQRTPENHGKAEAIIAKQRNGPIGPVPLVWLADQTRFADAAATERMSA